MQNLANKPLAQSYYEVCLSWARQKGVPIATSWAKVRLGYLAARRGEPQSARSSFREALQSFQAIGVQNGVLFTLEGLASLAVTQNEYDKAVRIFAWADATRERMEYQRPPVEQASVERDLAVIHSKLNEAEFEKLSTDGRAMTTEQAIALALEE